METQRTAEFIRQAENNRRMIEKLEKEITVSVQWRKNMWTEAWEELDAYERALEEERNAEKMNLQKQMVKIQNRVRRFKRHLSDVKPTAELIERMREMMSEVETSINSLKEEQRLRLQEYLREERTCQQEISAYVKKMEHWSLPVKDNPKVAPTTTKIKAPDKNLPVEVQALDVFLQRTGGADGGWDQSDHQAFLKVWMKHGGRWTYRKEAKLCLPGKSPEELDHHEEWYKELLLLQDRKRQVVQTWKSQKNQQVQSLMKRKEEEEEEERRKKAAQHQNHHHRSEEERRELVLQLQEWREKKKRLEEEEEEKRAMTEIQKRRREKRQQQEVKMMMEEKILLRRREEDERQRREKEKERREEDERRKEATKSIRRFSQRDLHKLEVKVHEKQQKEKEEKERNRRIAASLREKVNIRVNKDPSRLTTPTKGWQERLKHVGSSQSGPSSHMFHRAVPTWRQGL
ncbi:coiled-coil domain-containing protein 112 isoform X2 [Gouania willdenowi]|uniref:coiled-coil domain-containing protein 112 isoform X2 n=1 Tax=Gouania willdenowi TaxID=441366 RepID=UPI0010569147|nr:coiled-coil domain-containing protein 112 isoform X2 [Gouania willdenowi]